MGEIHRGLCAALLLAFLSTHVTEAQQQRALLVDDLLKLQELATAAVSPDGEWLAVVITRPRSNGETYREMPFLWEVDHADVWLVPSRGGKQRNLTKGAADGSGYWNPVWSPDGKRIAMLSTKGGDNIRPYVWEMTSGRLRRLTEQGVDLGASTDDRPPAFAMLWRDSTTLLIPVLPMDEATPYISKLGSYRQAIREWAKAEKGAEPTVSVLESGREIPAAERPTGQLLAIDAVSGVTQVLAEGNFRRLLLSPTGRHLALIAETGRVPPPPLLARADMLGVWRTRLAMLGLHEGAKAAWIDSIYDLDARWEAAPHRWSPDGSLFAAVGKSAQGDSVARTLFVVSLETNGARRLTDERLEVSATAWSGGGDLLALSRDRGVGIDRSARSEWIAIDRRKGGQIRNLTDTLGMVPEELFTTPLPDRMLGLSGGDLWSVDLHGKTRNLTAAFAPEVEEVVWPTGPQRRSRWAYDLVVRGRDNSLYRVSWKGTAPVIASLRRPTAEATFVAFDPEHQLAIFTGTEPNGTFLWIGSGDESPVSRIALNQHVREIADTKRLLIDYQGIDGDSLKALVLLPWNYQKGKRYPLVTWVHHGAEVIDTTFYGQLDKQNKSSLNRLLIPAHGYALLIPSMPLPRERTGTDPYLDLPKYVLPAVDRVVQLGIADPNRLGLIGHSYGGYSTYALVTYTNRFTAAVALAGQSNLVSNYGTFITPDRYGANAHENLFFPAWSEDKDGQGQMYAPPWEDLWRYLRNSPLYFAERVQTPLMIIQGDMDYVPIQQGEEFFTALYRMGKEAKFVRYWGEGHSVESPSNVKDMWQRIFGWFDEHMRADEGVTEN